jgi:hypothetical protein
MSMRSETREANRQEPPERQYEAPRLRVLGEVQALTEGPVGGGHPDAVFPMHASA